MTDPNVLSQRQRDFEKEASNRFHDHGKHISRIEGIMEERTRNLREANVELRQEIAAMSEKVEKVEERLTGKIENLASSVNGKIDGLSGTVASLSQSVTKQGVYIGIGAALGASIFSVLIQRLADAF